MRKTTACVLVRADVTSGMVKAYLTAFKGLVDGRWVVFRVRQFRFGSSFFLLFLFPDQRWRLELEVLLSCRSASFLGMARSVLRVSSLSRRFRAGLG